MKKIEDGTERRAAPRLRAAALIRAASILLVLGFGCAGPENGDGGVPAEGGGMDANVGDGGGSGDSGVAGDSGRSDDSGLSGDGGDSADGGDAAAGDGGASMDGSVGVDAGPPAPCVTATCGGMGPFLCANCIDDDMDGLVDSEDPDCVGACDNNESGYELLIPGSETPSCNLDCYFDDDQGSGNDGCRWSSFCDPLNRDGRTRPPDCIPHDPGLIGSATCPTPQSAMCHTTCDMLTPNGCDCFGCCELPARSGMYVFLGSAPVDGAPPCSAATLTNPDSCHPCTPTADCLNTCGRCEVCLGSTVDDLPCDCFSGGSIPSRCMPDAGIGLDAGPGTDAGPDFDGGPGPGTDAGVDLRCPDGRQPCGLASDPACPADHFCQTGCCTFFG